MVGLHHRGGTFSPSPSHNLVTAGSHSRDSSPSTSSPTSATNSLAKIAIAQIYLLLSTIKEDKDRTKWELQAEQLRKLVDEHGMEVFPKYFSRLVVSNASTIFPTISRPPPAAHAGNYQILVGEIKKLTRDVDQATKIADSIESGSEDVFRDFDLSTFMEHFKMDAIGKTILALACKMGTKSDLKMKADAILAANLSQFLDLLSRADQPSTQYFTDGFFTTIVDRYIQYHPPNFGDRSQAALETAIHRRYETNGVLVPTSMAAALYLRNLLVGDHSLPQLLQRAPPSITADEDTCLRALRNMSQRIDEEEVAASILYASISLSPKFSTEVLVGALRRFVPRTFRWAEVIPRFDKPGLRVTPAQFSVIFKSLLPLTATNVDPDFDIECFWTGQWQNSETQLSFLSAFTSIPGDDLQTSRIPGFTKTINFANFQECPDTDVVERAQLAVGHGMSAVRVIRAIVNLAFKTQENVHSVEAKRLQDDVISPNLDIFVVATLGGVPRSSWPGPLKECVTGVFARFIEMSEPNWKFAMYTCWHLDQNWVREQLEEFHRVRHQDVGLIVDAVAEISLLRELITAYPTGFSIDIAAIAHARGKLDITYELSELQKHFPNTGEILSKYLDIKSKAEIELAQGGASRTAMLPVRTVMALLSLMTEVGPGHMHMTIQRQCLLAYPRLINYGEGFDEIIDANGLQGNTLPKEAVTAMEETLKALYARKIEPIDVLKDLRRYKTSEVPLDQDIFACMISSLFEEYNVFKQYPLDALKTTALLFGGIISYELLPEIPLETGLGLVYEAIKDSMPTDPMYKFGLQAITNTMDLFDRWPSLCQRLVQLPQLEGTEVFVRAKAVVDAAQHANGMNENGFANGNIDDDSTPNRAVLTSVHADPAPADFEEPTADTQERVNMILNNVTNDNKDAKFVELNGALNGHCQTWFARHLVESRAKTQPNYHHLYLDIVEQFGDRTLWAEVLRETLVSVVKMLNAEATASTASERTLLKNLGEWLGSVTLAREKPIKHKNIAFKQLLHEAYHTQRLIFVLPFVCKVLSKAEHSTIFTEFNPWMLDILKCLKELYETDLKLNLKFEIEVLLKDYLHVPIDALEPWDELHTFVPMTEELVQQPQLDIMEDMAHLGVNGLSSLTGRFSPQDITSNLPDLSTMLTFPPDNDMVDRQQMEEVVTAAITKALYEIIAPVVERSVTIAAISTSNMIAKDFVTEPSEARYKEAAIRMVKRTAGELALVTSKEPLRASMTNYIRQMSQSLQNGLPEGSIIISVNANLDLVCKLVEKRAEERAVPEIEEMIESQMELRRQYRLDGAREPFYNPSTFSRWAMTIPAPYRLMPNPNGLNAEQRAIYDEFATQRPMAQGSSAHGLSSSDASRNMANEVLQDVGYSNGQLSNVIDGPTMQQIAMQQQSYSQTPAPQLNGRSMMDLGSVCEKIGGYLTELLDVAKDIPEEEIPQKGHLLHNAVDGILQLLIRCSTIGQLEPLRWTFEHANARLFTIQELNPMVIEALVNVMKQILSIQPRLQPLLLPTIEQMPDDRFFNGSLIDALLKSRMLELQRLDLAISRELLEHSRTALSFLSIVVHTLLLTDRPTALRTDFARSFEAMMEWLRQDHTLEDAKQLIRTMSAYGIPPSSGMEAVNGAQSEQFEYTFESWNRLCINANATDISYAAFVDQLHSQGILKGFNNTLVFLRICVERAVHSYEMISTSNDIYQSSPYEAADHLARLVVWLVKLHEPVQGESTGTKAEYLASILSVIVLVVNHHHVMRCEHFCQKVFFRLFATILHGLAQCRDEFHAFDTSEILRVIAETLTTLAPERYPGFAFGWVALVTHKDFLPEFLRRQSMTAWEPLTALFESWLRYVGEMAKELRPSELMPQLYLATVKSLLAIRQDWPLFLSANHTRFLQALPMVCTQPQNIILSATPLQPQASMLQGAKGEFMDESRNDPQMCDVESIVVSIRSADLLELINQALRTGPSEDAIAHIANAVQKSGYHATTAGHVPVSVDTKLINAIVLHTGMVAVQKAQAGQGAIFVSASTDFQLLNMLVRELGSEARYYFLSSIVNQLRFPSTHTNYFGQALLELFGCDFNDQEQMEIRQQIVRIILERSIGHWTQPWGLLLVIVELMKNEKYMFFEMPFIKADHDIVDRLTAIAMITRN